MVTEIVAKNRAHLDAARCKSEPSPRMIQETLLLSDQEES
jgi:hypothetical protein